MRAAQSALVEAEQQFRITSVALDREAASMQQFVSAALIQGRAIFPPGTAARHALDSIRPRRARAAAAPAAAAA